MKALPGTIYFDMYYLYTDSKLSWISSNVLLLINET